MRRWQAKEHMIQAARKMSSLSVTSVHEGSSYRVETPIKRESHDFTYVRLLIEIGPNYRVETPIKRESHDFTYVRLLIEIGPNMGANLDRC